MLAAIELVEDKGSKAPAKGLGARVVAEAANRGLILRLRGAADGPPASGDTLCFAPPLPTPEATLERIVTIVGRVDPGGDIGTISNRLPWTRRRRLCAFDPTAWPLDRGKRHP